MTGPVEIHHLIAAGSSLAGGLLLGLFIYRLVLRPLVKHSTLTQAGADDVILPAIRKATVLWFAVAGAFAARLSLPLAAGPARV
ncbi:MAG TPA: mechanosensitive ion channel family protein, partial [Actinomycetota bacterium]|nr:mechanosensitive ion channel family protein [Actinomycetota bacterium]